MTLEPISFQLENYIKSHVKLLAKELQLPEQIVHQPSSPGFWKGQLAEKEIGLPYHEIDRILESYQTNDLNKCKLDKRKIKLVTDDLAF